MRNRFLIDREAEASNLAAEQMGKIGPSAFLFLSAAIFAAAAPNAPMVAPARGPRVGIDTAFGEVVHEANRLFHLAHFRDAVAKINVALAMHPDDKNASLLYALRGHCFWDLDQDREALTDYNEAIRRDRKVEGVRGRRGILEYRDGNISAAIDDLTAALHERQEGPAYFYYARAIVLQKAGKSAEAQRDYERVTQLPPKDSLGYCCRGESFLQLGKATKAKHDLEIARRMGPADAFVLNELAWMEATFPEAEFRNGKAAVRDATHACELSHWNEAEALDTLAASYAEAGDFGQAQKYERRALALKPGPEERNPMLEHLALFEKNQPVRDDALEGKE